MKRITIHAVNLIFALLTFAGSSSGQVATGIQAFNSYGGGPFDVVNLGSLNVNFTIPVLHKAGREMPFTYDLSFDNSIWTPVTSSGTTSWQPPTSGFGWNGLGEYQAGKLTYGTYSFTAPCNPPNNMTNVTVTVYSNWVYTEPSGAAHSLGGATTQNTGGSCPQREFSTAAGASTDGSGYTLNVTNFTNGVLYSRPGKTLNLPINLPSGGASTVTDANGNQIVTNSSGTFIDTLGQTVLTAAGGGASPLTFTYTAPSTGAAAVTVSYATYTVKTNFGCSLIGEYNQSGVTLVDRVTLPDSTYYQFTYEPTPGGISGQVTGRLVQITLPTGSTIAYAYNYLSGHHNGIICSDGSTDLTTRTLTAAPTPARVWTYTRTQVSGNHWQTKVTTPPDPQNAGNASDDTVIDFQKDSSNGSYSFYETQRQAYQGASGGTLLLTTLTCWNGNTSNCTTTAVSSAISQCAVTLQYSGVNAQQSKTTTFYNSIGLPTEVDQYAYGSGARGPDS
jgi:hypothetical protein